MPNSVAFNEQDPTIAQSDELYARAVGLMPPVTQTLAKGPTQFIQGVAPKYLSHGKGCRVWDVDGNEFIDYNMGVGPVSLGYCYDVVDQAIRAQLEKGITFSLIHELEVVVSELIREVIPNAESVRISKTGADVCSAAIRLARAYTGRDQVLCCGYHGWHDWYVSVMTARKRGIPEAVQQFSHTFTYNDLDSLKRSLNDQTACVIMEPVVFEAPQADFLQQVQALCQEHGALLIFDEMWTGFRLDVGGAQRYFDMTPDLAVYSKAVANGMPISFLTGRTEFMRLLEDEIFFFTTFGGEALSLAAAQATIEELRKHQVPAYMARQGQKLRLGYNELAEAQGLADVTRCIGYDCRTMVTFQHPTHDPLVIKSFVQQEMIRRGILWSGSHNMSFSHGDEDVDYTLKVYEDVLGLLKKALEGDTPLIDLLRGKPIEPVFRKTSDFDTKPVQPR